MSVSSACSESLVAGRRTTTITPLPGDIIFYDWDEKRLGDCTGWADHVGIVVGTKWPFVKVIEGNRDDAVAYRVIPLGEIHIRGYGLPDYAAMTEKYPVSVGLRGKSYSSSSRISLQ